MFPENKCLVPERWFSWCLSSPWYLKSRNIQFQIQHIKEILTYQFDFQPGLLMQLSILLTAFKSARNFQKCNNDIWGCSWHFFENLYEFCEMFIVITDFYILHNTFMRYFKAKRLWNPRLIRRKFEKHETLY